VIRRPLPAATDRRRPLIAFFRAEYAWWTVAEAPKLMPEPLHDVRVVVAGASAGGVEALLRFVGRLPTTIPYAVLVVLHVAPSGTSVLPSILARAARVPVASPADGDVLRNGHVYVAPPDRHLLVEDGVLRLSQAPRENGHRPAIDPTMRSAAQQYGPGAVGIVLSGSRDDGTAGLVAIKEHGGLALAQDPDEALYDSMPRSAIAHVAVDAVLPVDGMADWILRVEEPQGIAEGVRAPGDSGAAAGNPGGPELDVEPVPSPPQARGDGTRFTCPDCGGVLFERREAGLERFACSVGHVYSIDSLAAAQAEGLESALWAAVRTLEDRVALLGRMAARAARSEHHRSARAFEAQARELAERAHIMRAAIEQVSADRSAAAEDL
jgi:two-component system chemotaxis response regulator CheB